MEWIIATVALYALGVVQHLSFLVGIHGIDKCRRNSARYIMQAAVWPALIVIASVFAGFDKDAS